MLAGDALDDMAMATNRCGRRPQHCATWQLHHEVTGLVLIKGLLITHHAILSHKMSRVSGHAQHDNRLCVSLCLAVRL